MMRVLIYLWQCLSFSSKDWNISLQWKVQILPLYELQLDCTPFISLPTVTNHLQSHKSDFPFLKNKRENYIQSLPSNVSHPSSQIQNHLQTASTYSPFTLHCELCVSHTHSWHIVWRQTVHFTVFNLKFSWRSPVQIAMFVWHFHFT